MTDVEAPRPERRRRRKGLLLLLLLLFLVCAGAVGATIMASAAPKHDKPRPVTSSYNYKHPEIIKIRAIPGVLPWDGGLIRTAGLVKTAVTCELWVLSRPPFPVSYTHRLEPCAGGHFSDRVTTGTRHIQRTLVLGLMANSGSTWYSSKFYVTLLKSPPPPKPPPTLPQWPTVTAGSPIGGPTPTYPTTTVAPWRPTTTGETLITAPTNTDITRPATPDTVVTRPATTVTGTARPATTVTGTTRPATPGTGMAKPTVPSTGKSYTKVPITGVIRPVTTSPNGGHPKIPVNGVTTSTTSPVGSARSVSPTSLTSPTSNPTRSTSPAGPPPTVPYIRPGTKPRQVSLSAACAKVLAPVDQMVSTMHSGALLNTAELAILNRVLQVGPKDCSAIEYRNWQYDELLPWMRMPPAGTQPAPTGTTTPITPVPTTKPANKGPVTVQAITVTPSALSDLGGTVTVNAQVGSATTCQLRLLSSQSFQVVYAHNPRPCAGDGTFTAYISLGGNPTQVTRTVTFELLASSGTVKASGRFHIILDNTTLPAAATSNINKS